MNISVDHVRLNILLCIPYLGQLLYPLQSLTHCLSFVSYIFT